MLIKSFFIFPLNKSPLLTGTPAASSWCPEMLSALIKRSMASVEGGAMQKVSLPALAYSYSALEPVISEEIMRVHHQGHHATYVNNLNAALERLISCQREGNLPGQIAAFDAVKFNGGGHINHSLVWENLKPFQEGKECLPTGLIGSMIEKQFGSFEQMKERFIAASASIQGSGYGWIGWCMASKQLRLATTLNQDILDVKGLIPLLAVDVWEHAYYLQYKNVKMQYLKGIWSIVNWECVNERLQAAQA
jgi:Fe-Mn family superoxide dismutase